MIFFKSWLLPKCQHGTLLMWIIEVGTILRNEASSLLPRRSGKVWTAVTCFSHCGFDLEHSTFAAAYKLAWYRNVKDNVLGAVLQGC